MTIVEAISKGMFVFGFNDSTMDEYIENDSVRKKKWRIETLLLLNLRYDNS